MIDKKIPIFTKLRVLIFLLLVFCAFADKAKCDKDDSTIQLDDIIISATRNPASLNNVTASSSLITEDQIKKATTTNLKGLLGSSNLVQILDYGTGSLSSVSIRGSTSSQVLILVDGERLNSPLSGGVDIDNLPLANIKRVEIIRGGQSAMYGADAVGGIINIITKQPHKPSIDLWTGAGSFSTYSYGIGVSEQLRSFSGLILFSHDQSKSDFPFLDKNGRTVIRENADYKKRNATGKIIWNFSDSTNFTVSLNHSYSDNGSPGMVGLYTPEATKRERWNNVKIDIEHDFSSSSSFKASANRRDTVLRYIDPQYPYPTDDTHKSNTTSAEIQTFLLKETLIPLTFGIQIRDEDVNSTTVKERNRIAFGGYIQQELRKVLSDNLLNIKEVLIFPAIRWDHYSDFESGLSPKFGLLASFGKNFSIKANAGRSYRAPTMNDLYWPEDPYTSGNPDLKPERSVDMDTGFSLTLIKPSIIPSISMLRISATYFAGYLKDGIRWTPGQGGKWFPINISEINSSGFEIETKIKLSIADITDLLSLGSNYTFVRAEDKLKRQLTNQPKHAFGYNFQIGTEKLWAQVQGLYNSKRYYTVQNTKWLDPFIKHDIKIGTERRIYGVVKAILILEIRNIFDAKYQILADYPLPGREWNVKISFNKKGE
ncbi:MAG: TonB-dependent receptor plug domain-containing protein [bacterium]